MTTPSPTSPKRLEMLDVAPKKRRKGATRLSCAECRRLKLRCDRVVPCSSCVKRGCGAICPDARIAHNWPRKQHEKILQLATRVRQLEDALRTDHAQITDDAHPLLSDDLLKVKAPLQREPASARGALNIKEEEGNPPLVDAFGALSIDVSGGTNYYGHIASSAYLFQMEDAEEETDNELDQVQHRLPAELMERSTSFPIFPSPSQNQARAEQLNKLYWARPSPEKAAQLGVIYYRHAAWMYRPVSAQDFQEQIYSLFYDSNNSPPLDDTPAYCHKLSILFMVLAIGSLMDPELPSYNVEAEQYFHLARAALFQHSLVDDPTTNAVQALFLMSFYLFLGDRHSSKSGGRWTIMGMAVKMAQSIGLHRDNSRWNVDPAETKRRRELFWELYTYDSWQCMTFGRPPSFSLCHMDCKLPWPADIADENSFYAWKHRFTSECMSVLHDEAFGSRVPTYANILKLDRQMRSYPVPTVLQVPGFGNPESHSGGYLESAELIMQRNIVLGIRETNLLYLHRSFFAKAISDHPHDPLGSPYGSSVIAAYRSAGALIALQRNHNMQLPELSSRMYFLNAHLFSCAIILGAIVCRCPSMSLAPSALVQLDSACELFAANAVGFKAEKVLSVMMRLKDKAHASLEAFRQGKGSPTSARNSSESPLEGEDELTTLGGMTRLVKKEGSSNPSSPSAFGDNSVVPLNWSPRMPVDAVHPNVRDYLGQFPQAQPQVNPNYTAGMQYPSDYDPAPVQMRVEPRASSSRSTLMTEQQSPHTTYQYPQTVQSNGNPFPAYFPVYDYSAQQHSWQDANGTYNALMDRDTTMREEPNMQNTWSDFVSDFGA